MTQLLFSACFQEKKYINLHASTYLPTVHPQSTYEPLSQGKKSRIANRKLFKDVFEIEFPISESRRKLELRKDRVGRDSIRKEHEVSSS